ncbi:hypothetical protein C8Q73DRAFT_784866 [Cubamyces lactineus]|nr:hypothetical protein C8Q73DRAFT_784866 [Cubamyces lactineus]
MSANLPADIPESVALSIGLKPLQAPFYFSRAGKAARKERNVTLKSGRAAELQEQKEKRSNSKTIRVRVGRLTDLMDMSIDIFLEVSEEYRYLLNAYQACGVARSTNTDFARSLRFCAPCYKTNFKRGDELNLSSYKLSDQFIKNTLSAMLVSVVKGYDMDNFPNEFNAKSNWIHRTFYLPEVKAVLVRYTALPVEPSEERIAFIRERHKYVTTMQTHGLDVVRWLSKAYQHKREGENNAREGRAAAILRKLEGLGYTPSDYPDSDAWNKILNQPRELTDRIWTTVRPKLEALIKQKREDDGHAQFEARLKERFAEFQPIYEEFIRLVLQDHVRDFAPNWTDACRLPCIVELASSDGAFPRVTFERVAAIDVRLRTEVLDSICQIKRDLLEMLHREHCRVHPRDARPMPHLGMEQVDAELVKATSLFVCHRCPLQTAASASQICVHWRTEHPELKWNDAWPIDEMFDRRRKRSEWPKLLPWVCAMPSGPSCAKNALVALGIPDDTPYIALDDVVRQGRLLCLCGSPAFPAPSESGWGALIKHVADEQAWHHRMQLFSKPNGSWHSFQLIENHSLSGPNPCLKLLSEGERAEVPDYSMPADAAAVITTRLEHDQRQPVCSFCYSMLKDGSKRTHDIHLPRDIAHIAHHLKTRHDETLSDKCILFVDV